MADLEELPVPVDLLGVAHELSELDDVHDPVVVVVNGFHHFEDLRLCGLDSQQRPSSQQLLGRQGSISIRVNLPERLQQLRGSLTGQLSAHFLFSQLLRKPRKVQRERERKRERGGRERERERERREGERDK